MRKCYFILLFVICAHCALAQMTVSRHSSKLTATAVRLLGERHRSGVSGRQVMANVYVRVAAGADLRRLESSYGVRLNVGNGRVYTAVLPAANIEALAADPAVESVDAGQEVHFMMDSVRRRTGIDAVHAGAAAGTPYKGKDVMVGIIDAGFDFMHPNFRDSEGKCRILAVWDQNNFFTTDSDYGYGREYRTPEDVAAAMRDMELTGDTHGTHVAGIAAGSYGGAYLGVAPEAGIVLVSTNKSEQGIVDGIDYLLKYADKAGMPMSINLSIGTVLGYKDGTDNFTMLVDSLMSGQTGRVISIAGGNEGDRMSTLSGTFGDGRGRVSSYWVPPSYNRDNLFVQCTADFVYTLTLSLLDTAGGDTLFTRSFRSDSLQTLTFENFGTLADDNGRLNVSVSENPANGNPCFSVTMTYGMPENEVWEVSLAGAGGRYMINSDYGEFASMGSGSHSDGTNDCSIAATATGYNSVTVGAYVSKDSYTDLSGGIHSYGMTVGDIYPLSGKGPTFDGRIKPDVAAPGATVVSSFSSYASSYYVKNEDKVASVTDGVTGRNYTWGVASGTSMATPVVTGTLALWLEADPTLTLDGIRDVIAATSASDSFTGSLPDGTFGYGKLDALAGLRYILGGTSVGTVVAEDITRRYADGVLTVTAPAGVSMISVYSVSGMLIRTVSGTSGSLSVSMPRGGIYLVKVTAGATVHTFKMAV